MEVPLKIFKRFLDDIFQIFIGTTNNLHKFLDEINQVHQTIKFTMSHTSVNSESNTEKCSCEPVSSIPFLDTNCSIINGKIDLDLYRKETDCNQYLLTDSCHPKSTTVNIPYSLSLRIVRICTKEENSDKRSFF